MAKNYAYAYTDNAYKEDEDSPNQSENGEEPDYSVETVIPTIQRFKVVSFSGENDYLTCIRIDSSDTEYGYTIRVALPYLLRHVSARNGIGYLYTSFNNRTTTAGQLEYITPAFVEDDIIIAVGNIMGGTGVTNVDWYMLPDSRAWCADWYEET